MKRTLTMVAAIGAAACAGQAWAQTPPPAAAPPAAAPAQAPAPAVGSDAELQSFARATLKLHALTQPTPEQMGEAITGAGLTVERYNAMAAQMQSDPAFQSRVNQALIQAQQNSPTAAATPAPAAPPPPLPTSGPGASVLSVLDNVCLPMLRQGQQLASVGPRAGLKQNKKEGTYTAVLGQAPYSLSVRPRGSNQNVCDVEIRHPIDAGAEIAKALNIWTMHQQPEMKMVRNDAGVGADGLKRITLSWEQSGGRGAALVYVRVQHADGSPIEKDVGSATLLYSERPS